MDFVLDWLNGFVSDPNHPLGLLILAASSVTEYLFPPFPGDTVTLFAGVLVAAYHWNLALVFAAVVLGAQVGAILNFWLGRAIEKRRTPKDRAVIDRLIAGFQRHGAAYLVVNRFLPGVRPLFFVAAGMAKMGFGSMFLWSFLSNVLWTAALFVLGHVVGENLDTMVTWVGRYSWLALGLVVLFAVGWGVLRARKKPAER